MNYGDFQQAVTQLAKGLIGVGIGTGNTDLSCTVKAASSVLCYLDDFVRGKDCCASPVPSAQSLTILAYKACCWSYHTSLHTNVLQGTELPYCHPTALSGCA